MKIDTPGDNIHSGFQFIVYISTKLHFCSYNIEIKYEIIGLQRIYVKIHVCFNNERYINVLLYPQKKTCHNIAIAMIDQGLSPGFYDPCQFFYERRINPEITLFMCVFDGILQVIFNTSLLCLKEHLALYN